MNQNDFEKWSRKIENTINDAADELQKIIDNPLWSNIYGKEGNPIRRNNQVRTSQPAQPAPPKKPPLYGDTTGMKAGGILMSIFGYGMAGFGSLFWLISMFMMFADSFAAGRVAAFVFYSLFAVGGLILGLLGTKKLRRVKRFREYVAALGKYTFIQLEKLTNLTGRTPKFLRKDLQEMIDDRMFLQGHLDDEGENLIVSDETYNDYLNLMENQRALKEQEEKSNADLEGLSTEGKRILRQGEEYLRKIKQANDSLPGEVISMKLYELENVIRRILEEVKRQPESATDLRKLMNYYLPTTWKLIEAYKEVEEQPVKTEQMLKTQLEIETTIDTINDACKKMLDQLFMKQAWDISSDISVLNSMLVQEGLKEGEYQLK